MTSALYKTVAAFDAFTLGSGPLANVSAIVEDADGDDPTAQPQFLGRSGQRATFVQSEIDPRDISILFKTPSYADQQALIQALDFPTSTATKAVRYYLGDPDSPTLCESEVAIKQLKRDPGSVVAICQKADATWSAVTPRTIGPATFSAAGAMTVPNNGDVRSFPVYQVRWGTQRASTRYDLGWKYAQPVPITNNTDRDWEDEAICVLMTGTDALVSGGKALSSGDDLRVWTDGGDQLNRTLVTWNKPYSLVWFLVSIPAGQSATYFLVYGNANAHTPDDLSTHEGTGKTYVAYDLEGDSGTCSRTGDSVTMYDTSKTWPIDRWKNGWVGLVSGTGSIRWRRIYSNGAHSIVFNRSVGTPADNTTGYVIWMSGVFKDGGKVTAVTANSITDDQHTNAWGVNELAGATVTFNTGTAVPSTMTVDFNTGSKLTFTTSFSVNPTVADSFTIQRLGTVSYMTSTDYPDTIHRGIYRENAYGNKPGRIWWNGDTPGGWMPETRNPNSDTYLQRRPYQVSGQYWPLLRVLRKVKEDKQLTDEGDGDGMSTYCAYGFQGWRFDFKVQNDDGIGECIFAVLKSTGESWETVASHVSVHSTLSTQAVRYVNLNTYENPPKLYMGVTGDGDDEIPTDTSRNTTIELRNGSTLQLVWDLDAFGDLTSSVYQGGTEFEFYDLGCTLRVGGGSIADPTPPYTQFEIGRDGHRVMLKKGVVHEQLWISPDPDSPLGLFSIYNPDDGTWTDAPWAGVINDYVKTGGIFDDTAVAEQSNEFAPIRPGPNLVANGSFTTDVDDWTMTPSAGVTAQLSWDSGENADADTDGGALKVHVTSTPVGAWHIDLTYPQVPIVSGLSYDFGIAAMASALGASLAIEETVLWEPLNGIDSSIDCTPSVINSWTYAADGHTAFEKPDGYGIVTIANNETTADITIRISGSGSYSNHNVWIDLVTLGVPNLYLSEDSMGSLAVQVTLTERFLG